MRFLYVVAAHLYIEETLFIGITMHLHSFFQCDSRLGIFENIYIQAPFGSAKALIDLWLVSGLGSLPVSQQYAMGISQIILESHQ